MINELVPLDLIRKIVSGEIEVGKLKNIDSIIQNEIKSLCFPIDKVYISFSSKSPASILGGSWTHLNSVFLYSASSESASAGSTGGASTHMLTTSEMPSHTHDVTLFVSNYMDGAVTGSGYCVSGVGEASGKYGELLKSGRAEKTGSGSAFSILPPYITVHMWRKTA